MSTVSPDQTPVTLKIEGMSCGHCVGAVRGALADVAGVAVDDVAIGSARIRARTSDDVAQAVRAIEDAGYEAHPA